MGIRAPNTLVFDAEAVTGTNAYNSEALPADQMVYVSCQAVTAGSNPNGTLKLQFSNDNPTSGTPTNWSDVTNATVSTTNNGVYAIQPALVCGQWVRFVYTNASGSGTITARYKASGP